MGVERMAGLMDALSLPVIGLSGTTISDLNSAAVALLGASAREDVIGKVFAETCVAENDRAAVRTRIAEVLDKPGEPPKTLKASVNAKTGRKQAVITISATQSERIVAIALHEVGEIKKLQEAADKVVGGGPTPAMLKTAPPAPLPTTPATLRMAAPAPLPKAPLAPVPAPVLPAAARAAEPSASAEGLPTLQDSSDATWAADCLSDLVDSANMAIYGLDTEGLVTSYNQMAGLLTWGDAGVPPAGTKLPDLALEGSADTLIKSLQAAMGSRDMPQPFELVLKSDLKGMDTVRLLCALTVQRTPDGRAVGALAMGVPVPADFGPTDDAPPDSSNTAPAQAQEMWGQAMGLDRKTKSMVTHELRSPLHGVIGLANTLAQNDGPLKRSLKMIGSSAERVMELLTNLLDFWCIAGDLNPDLDQDLVNLSEILQECISRSEKVVDKRGKSLRKDEVELKRNIGDLSMIAGSKQIVSMLFYHLITNAFKFTQRGHVEIIAQDDKQAEEVEVVIKDTGMGIAQKNVERIFQPFQQEDTSESRRYEGIGLGLAIVKAGVDIHGGTIKVDTTEEVGSTFTCRLPWRQRSKPSSGGVKVSATASSSRPRNTGNKPVRLPLPAPLPPGTKGPPKAAKVWLGPPGTITPPAPSRTAAAPAPSPQPAPSAPTPVAKPLGSGTSTDRLVHIPKTDGKITIMSVDDDYVNQEVMRSVLEPHGFDIIVCMSGIEACAYLAKEGVVIPDLILLDLMMPGMDGFEVLQTQRRIFSPQEMPILMVSAKNQTSSVVKGLELGCNDWVHKPFNGQELIARVKSNLIAQKTHRDLVAQSGSASTAEPVVASAAPTDPVPAPPAPAAAPTPAKPPAPLEDIRAMSTAALVAVVTARHTAGEESVIAKLFATFEELSSSHGVERTEIVGTAYLAILEHDAPASKSSKVHPANILLRLALKIQATVKGHLAGGVAFKCSFGIDAGVHPAPVVTGPRPRQYPLSCYYSAVVSESWRLAEHGAHRARLSLTRAARRQVTSELEGELKALNFTLVGPGAGNSSDHFYISGPGDSDADAAVPPTAEERLATAQTELSALRGEKEKFAAAQLEVAALRSERERWRQRPTAPAPKPKTLPSESFASNSKPGTVRGRTASMSPGVSMPGTAGPSMGSLGEVPTAATDAGCTGGTPGSGGNSLLFLQWQNAHMQAELRYCQQTLATAKAEMQVQALNLQAAESQRYALEQRIEHLELDLGLRAACFGGRPPPPGTAVPDMAAFVGVTGLEPNVGVNSSEAIPAMTFSNGAMPPSMASSIGVLRTM